MSRLVLKAHATRGKEVINLLEMLGANRLGYKDTFVGFYYYIECGAIVSSDECPIDAKVFTLEEFLEKYPYKVGGRVTYRADKLLETQVITNMRWDSNYDCVLYYLDDCNIIIVEDILYRIGCSEDNIPTIQEDIGTFKPSEGTLVAIDLTTELRIADEVEVILGDYEFVLKNGKTYFVKKKPNYPKTYKECCDVLGIDTMDNDAKGYKHFLVIQFQELLIARDAYWKIAGDWRPEFRFGKKKYCIMTKDNKVISATVEETNRILVFPTAEMRDAFYENFKELINEVKELL